MLLRVAVAALLLALLPSVAHAEKRVGLIIGNSAYANVPKLSNPGRDAGAMEALLRAAGFDLVEVRSDLGAAAMRRALRDFSDRVREADIAVVFYAGHGIEVNGTNYLIPVDAILERDIDVEDEAVPLDRITQMLEQAKRLRLVILDACRDNPFVRSMKRTVTSRSIGRGLAKVEVVGSDTLIAFAAKAGSTAADGEGANSPYTTALVKHLTTPGLDLRLALGRVRDEVLTRTRSRQEPFVYGSLGGAEIPLVPAAKPQTQPQTQAVPSGEAAEAWAAAKDTTSVAVLEAFIARYKDTFYADMARSRIEDLKRAQVAEAAKAAQEAAALQSRNEAEAKRLAEVKRAEEQRKREETKREAESTASPSAPVKVVSAPQSVEPTPSQQAVTEQASLTRSLKKELKRIGCDPGSPDGDWSTKASGALREFARKTKHSIPTDSPTEAALAALVGQKGRVCTVTCAPTETEQNGKCVLKIRKETAKPRVADQPTKRPGGENKGSTKMCWPARSVGSAASGLVPCDDPLAR